MKKAHYLLFILIITSTIQAQKIKQYWIDEDGKSIKQDAFLLKWRAENCDFARWDYKTKDSSRVSRLSHKKFETYKVDSKLFLNYFNTLSDKKYTDSTTFLIEYRFLDDYCDSKSPNNRSYEYINTRKIFTNKQKSQIELENKNVVYLVIYEDGIKFYKSKKGNEYYFTDKENFLRKNIFLNSTLCGSFLITKPDGLTLVRNGEYRADTMIQYLKPKIWNPIFQN